MSQDLINRDISWLSFNERVLDEAARPDVPLLERLKFLSIYSSNLDEFYRVRVPAIIALRTIKEGSIAEHNRPEEVNALIQRQQQAFGSLLRESLIPALRARGIHLLYREPVPESLKEELRAYFLSRVAAFIQVTYLSSDTGFFPENNKIYLAVPLLRQGEQLTAVINIPDADCGRFYTITSENIQYIVFLDDIIRAHLGFILPDADAAACCSFKVTRDAELELEDEFQGDIAEKIEQQINLRDLGLATRLLYDGQMPAGLLQSIIDSFALGSAVIVPGGPYHNLRDLGAFPARDPGLSYTPWPCVAYPVEGDDIMAHIARRDILLQAPYHRYDTLIRFFNQAAIDPDVRDISITLYRIAGDSLIAHALISAAKNGKNVTVFVELKARFDEANNIRWAKRMKAAGIKIIYSIPALKVHAKVALVTRREGERLRYYGVLATGNFNESTARFYTDHILLTARGALLRELELLFLFLEKRRKPLPEDRLELQHLLVAQFNLQERFLELIDREISLARNGRTAMITIKLNNLEEPVMIRKLYDASRAGVQVRLIIRGICRLKPGIQGLSEHIQVRRIVDRYLEHGRMFIFHNDGNPEVFLGSADWMNRNIHRRIEVCFPVYETGLKDELLTMTELQWQDTAAAVTLDEAGNNVLLNETGTQVRSQEAIYRMIRQKEG